LIKLVEQRFGGFVGSWGRCGKLERGHSARLVRCSVTAGAGIIEWSVDILVVAAVFISTAISIVLRGRCRGGRARIVGSGLGRRVGTACAEYDGEDKTTEQEWKAAAH